MGDFLQNLMGKKKPPQISMPKPIQKVTGQNTDTQDIMKQFAKQRQASVLANLTTPNLSKQTLGAGGTVL